MTTTVGIIGTGSLAGFFVEGIRRENAPFKFLLSPRNAAKASELANFTGVAIASDNQAVVDGAELVIVMVLPRQADTVLAPLKFRTGQIVLSVMATVSLERVESLVRPATAAVAMMPGHANAYGLGPSVLFPGLPAPRALLQWLGPVHVLQSEQEFTKASAFGALSGMSYLLLGEVINWFIRQGLDPDTARHLVAETLIGNAEVIRRSPEPLASIVNGVATPGGITETGANVLNERGALTAWTDALDQVLARIAGAEKA